MHHEPENPRHNPNWSLTKQKSPSATMDEGHASSSNLHSQIRYPKAENKDLLLSELGLDRLPTREEIHAKIEDKWLTPKDQLPSHWLSRYQVYVRVSEGLM
jgi:hypothetical protein